MSRSNVFILTVAPAPRHTLARDRSGPTALARSLLDLAHAPRCLPQMSNLAPHSHDASVTIRGRRRLSSINVRNRRGSTLNSVAVGAPCRTSGAWPRVRSQVSSVSGIRLGTYHSFSEVVFKRKRRVILPAMLPLARFSGYRLGRTQRLLQLATDPLWSSRLLAVHSSPRHPWPQAPTANWSMMCVVTWGASSATWTRNLPRCPIRCWSGSCG